jgi:hypothetical protein
MRVRFLKLCSAATLGVCSVVSTVAAEQSVAQVVAKDPCRSETNGEIDADSVECLMSIFQTITTPVASPELSPAGRSLSGPIVQYQTALIPKIWGASDGEVCVKFVEISVPEGQQVDLDGGLPHDRFAVCPPNLLRDPSESTTASGPAADSEYAKSYVYVLDYWKNVPLPKPQPFIAPGRAITGLLAYLETRGTTTHTYSEPDTPFGPLTIVATGRYYVDWGDGTHSGPHSREGEPWPDGQITHQYINVGAYDVVVTERWTAKWSLGSASGTLDELRTVGRIDDFPVQQIQAVVIR